MPWQITINRMAIPASDKLFLINEFVALRGELDDLRAKYGVLQAALNAGTAVGAAGYPNATTQLAPARFNATT